MRRPPLILWSSLTLDMLRLIAMSCGALVLVIALAAAIKPLASGVLETAEVLRFLGLAIPPMLAYALPFAACFGATLAYHRFASDREAIAAHAGGVSHASLLAPAVFTGLVLSLGLGYLNEQISPRYWREMEKLAQGEIARIVVREIEKGQPVRLEDGRMYVFADSAVRVNPPPETGALDQVRFSHLAVLRLDADATPLVEATASDATLWIFPPELVGLSTDDPDEQPFALGSLELRGVMIADRSGVAGFREASRVDFRVPRFFREKPKYMTWHELAMAARDPSVVRSVASARLRLAREIATHEALVRLDDLLAREGAARFVSAEGGSVTIEASGLGRLDRELPTTDVPGARSAPDDGIALSPRAGLVPIVGGRGSSMGVRVRVVPPSGPSGTPLVAVAPTGWVSIAPGPAGRTTITIDLSGARVADDTSDEATLSQTLTQTLVRGGWQLTGVRLDATPDERASIETLESRAREAQGPLSRRVERANEDQRSVTRRLKGEILAKRHERLAIAASCLVMVLAGAIIALRRADQLPLQVYLAAFLPAIACSVLTSGGAQVIGSGSGGVGVMLAWSGVVGLLLLAGLGFVRLSRH